MKNKMMGYLIIVLTLIMISACSSSSEEVANENGEYKFKMANVSEKSNIVSEGLEKFSEIVEEKSDGKIEVEIIHDSQLGTGVETFEAVRDNNLDFAADSFANLKSVTPAFEAFHLPFLFESKEQAWNGFYDEEVQEMLNDELSENNLRFFSLLDMGGPRQISTTNYKVESLDDLTKKKLRASRSPMEVEMQKSWGASGETVDWPDVPESLRLGMVDGITVSYPYILSAKLYEGDLINYIADINSQWYAYVTVVNEDTWSELPEDIQEILTESIREAEDWHNDYVKEKVEQDIADLREEGVEIYSIPDSAYEEIKQKTIDATWDKFIGEPGVSQEKVDAIEDAKGSAGDRDWGYSLE